MTHSAFTKHSAEWIYNPRICTDVTSCTAINPAIPIAEVIPGARTCIVSPFGWNTKCLPALQTEVWQECGGWQRVTWCQLCDVQVSEPTQTWGAPANSYLLPTQSVSDLVHWNIYLLKRDWDLFVCGMKQQRTGKKSLHVSKILT